MTHHVLVPLTAYIENGDEEVLKPIGTYTGALRVESDSDRYPFAMIIFDGQCSEVEGYGIEELSERIHEAGHLINEWTEHRGVAHLDRIRFIFEDTSAAMMFKLANGGAL